MQVMDNVHNLPWSLSIDPAMSHEDALRFKKALQALKVRVQWYEGDLDQALMTLGDDFLSIIGLDDTDTEDLEYSRQMRHAKVSALYPPALRVRFCDPRNDKWLKYSHFEEAVALRDFQDSDGNTLDMAMLVLAFEHHLSATDLRKAKTFFRLSKQGSSIPTKLIDFLKKKLVGQETMYAVLSRMVKEFMALAPPSLPPIVSGFLVIHGDDFEKMSAMIAEKFEELGITADENLNIRIEYVYTKPA